MPSLADAFMLRPPKPTPKADFGRLASDGHRLCPRPSSYSEVMTMVSGSERKAGIP